MIGPVGFMAPRVVSVPRLFAQVRRVLLGVCVEFRFVADFCCPMGGFGDPRVFAPARLRVVSVRRLLQGLWPASFGLHAF